MSATTYSTDAADRLGQGRRTKTILPKNRREFRRQFRGVMRFIERPALSKNPLYLEWQVNIREHYIDVLYDLVSYPPMDMRGSPELAKYVEKGLSCLQYYRML